MLFNTDVTASETSYFEQPLYMQMVKKLIEKSVCTFLQPTHLRSLKNGRFCPTVTSDYALLFAESAGWVQQGTGSFHQGETREGVWRCRASMGRLPQRGEPQGRVPYTLNSQCHSVCTHILPHDSCLSYYPPVYTDTPENSVFCVLFLHNDIALHASASVYTHNLACNAWLYIRLHYNFACTACHCVWLHSHHFS